MLIDSHVHIGQFYQMYIGPSQISYLMHDIGIDAYAISSTTMCEENYPKVLEEIDELLQLDGKKVLPTMWITPEGLKGNIAWFLESNINWRCLKIHPFLHPQDWDPQGDQFAEVIDIANELEIPILIHTGNECCQANKYEFIIKNYPKTTFILAHGGPHLQALALTRKYENAYVDSAFMPINDMKDFVQDGLSHKLLWGTDMCIPQYYNPKINLKEYYINKLNAFRNVCTQLQFEEVTYKNATKIFNII